MVGVWGQNMAVHKAFYTRYFIWSSLHPFHVGVISNLSAHPIASYLYSGYNPNQTTSYYLHHLPLGPSHNSFSDYFKSLSAGLPISTQQSEWSIMYIEVWLCRSSAQSHPMAPHMIPNKSTVPVVVYKVFYHLATFLLPDLISPFYPTQSPWHPWGSFSLSLNTTSTVESQYFCICFLFIKYSFHRYLCGFHSPLL